MSSRQYATPLVLEPLPSRRLAVFLIGVHGLALAAVFVAELNVCFVLALCLLLAVTLYRGLGRHAWLCERRSVVRLIWGNGDNWLLTCRDGHQLEARLSPDSFCRPWLAVLDFKITRWRRVTVILPGDAAPGEKLRQLRVRMKLAAYAGPQAVDDPRVPD